MTDIQLDTLNKRLVIENGDLKLISTFGELVRQRVHITLKTFKGEWKFNILFGVPYIANSNNTIQLLGKSVPKDIFDKYIRDAVLSVNGVDSITKFSSILDTSSRSVSISVECLLTDESTLSVLDTFSI